MLYEVITADDVVVDVLRRERPAGRLAVRAQGERAGVLRREWLHQPGPQHAGGAQLGSYNFV